MLSKRDLMLIEAMTHYGILLEGSPEEQSEARRMVVKATEAFA